MVLTTMERVTKFTASYVVYIDSTVLSSDEINKWCINQFGPAVARYDTPSSEFKWGVHNSRLFQSIYEFYNEDDATLFRLTWT